MMVQMSAQVTTENEVLSPAEAKQFFAELPPESLSGNLTMLTTDRGSQRDPSQVLVGLKVTWQEER